VQHEGVNLGATWLTDQKALSGIWDKEL